MEPYFEIDKELVDALILEIHLEFVRKRGDVTRVIWSRKQEFYGFKLGEFSLMQSNLREALIFWWLIRERGREVVEYEKGRELDYRMPKDSMVAICYICSDGYIRVPCFILDGTERIFRRFV